MWEVTLISIRRWCSDMRLRYIRPAVAIVICGSIDGRTPALLYCSVLEECTATSATSDLLDCLRKVPSFYRPKEVRLRYSAESLVLETLKRLDVHDEDAIGEEVKSSLEGQMSRFCSLQNILTSFGASSASSEQEKIVFSPYGTGVSETATWKANTELQDIISWMHEERKMFPDVSLKALPLESYPDLCLKLTEASQQYPFLSSQRLARPKGSLTVDDGVNIVCTAFSTSGVAYPHVVAVQRPYIVPPPEDNQMAPRPQQPQPVGVEFHLHKYVGDAMFVKNTLNRPFNVETYEDLIHQDGEVYVQFGPVEGSSFADVEFIQKHYKATEGWGETVGVGSAFPNVAVPRVIFNKPGGKIERKTPVDSPKMVIVGDSADEEMLSSALAAVNYFCTVLYDGSAPNKESYNIKWDAAVLGAPEVTPLVCNFCGRRREAMKRCGGCKVATYCCVEHQAQDWKGNHKKECKWLKIARDDYGSLLGTDNDNAILEDYSARLEAEQAVLGDTPNKTTPVDGALVSERAKSSAATFWHLLSECGINIQDEGTPTVIHVLNVENAECFLEELGKSDFQQGRQLRIVLVQSAAATGAQNDVLSLSTSSTTFQKLPATGALGDVWHTEGRDPAEYRVLVRLYHDKYITLQTGHTLMQPDAVISLGSTKYEGMTFFHSATSIIADSHLGKIPVAISEPHYVTAHRTLGAVLGRLEMSGANPLRRQTKKQSLTWMCKQSGNLERCQFGIEVCSNKSYLTKSPVPPSIVVKQCQMESLPRIPLHVNAYYCLFVPTTKVL